MAAGNTAFAFAPRVVGVEPPPYTPRPYGLFSVVSLVDIADSHELNGVQVAVPTPLARAGAYSDGCEPDVEADGWTRLKSSNYAPAALDGVNPLTIIGGWECAPVGFSQAAIDANARQALINGEERAWESVIASGLTDNGVLFTAIQTFAADFTETADALGAIERLLALEYGGIGVIHLPTALIPFLFEKYLIEKDGQRLVTSSGRHYVTSNPYLAYTAATEAATIAVTGSIVIRRGPIDPLGDFRSSLTRGTNDLIRLMERTEVLLTEYDQA